ncbi:MAG TPA: NAD-binding protein [Chloroflexota bacterium]|nr:NAD-binding protein [Chloroflexota bacterium]
MKVLIVGAGQVGFNLAEVLKNEGQTVVVVERDADRARYLRDTLNVAVFVGDGDDPTVLDDAGIRGADAVCATTGEDEDNLVVGTLARFEFDVPHTLARVNDPRNEWLYGPELGMGIDVAISEAHLMAETLRARLQTNDELMSHED